MKKWVIKLHPVTAHQQGLFHQDLLMWEHEAEDVEKAIEHAVKIRDKVKDDYPFKITYSVNEM